MTNPFMNFKVLELKTCWTFCKLSVCMCSQNKQFWKKTLIWSSKSFLSSKKSQLYKMFPSYTGKVFLCSVNDIFLFFINVILFFRGVGTGEAASMEIRDWLNLFLWEFFLFGFFLGASREIILLLCPCCF